MNERYVQLGTPQRSTALDVGVLLWQPQLNSRGDAASTIARIEGTTPGAWDVRSTSSVD